MARKNKGVSFERISLLFAGFILLTLLVAPVYAEERLEEAGMYEKNFCLTAEQKKNVIGEIESAVSSMTNAGMSDLEKYYTLAVWENKRVTYDDDFWNFSYNYDYYRHQWDSYGALTEKSVCVGMSMLYANLCHAADLPCKFVRFKTGEIDHNLNYVPDLNGNAYYVDVTENNFLLSDAASMLAGKVDKAYSNITKDCTDHTFEYSGGPLEPLESTDLKECHNKPYREWFNEYALHNTGDPKKVFSTAYVERGSGDGTKHASYRDFTAYPAQRYASRSSGVTGIWFLDDFYEEPVTIRSKILNRELDGQLLTISGIKDNYDCESREELEAAVSSSLSEILYFPSVENGIVTAKTAKLEKGRDYEVTYSGHDASSNEEVFQITGIGEYSGTYQLRIKMNFASVKKAPVRKKGLVYSGSPQELVEPGEAEYGTMVYAISKAGDPEPASHLYSSSIPTATDSGSYYVWYKVVGNTGHFDTPVQRIMGAVKIDPEDAYIEKESDKEIKIGDTLKLTPRIRGGLEAAFSFSTSNNGVVTVSEDGVLSGAGEGKAEIIIKAVPKSPNYYVAGFCSFMVSVIKPGPAAITPSTADKPSDQDSPQEDVPAVLPGEEEQEAAILAQESTKDVKNSTFHLLQARQKSAKKNAISIRWNRVSGATKYVVYGGRYGKKLKKLKTLSGTSFTQKKLKPGETYQFIVAAYGGGKALATSKTIFITTAGGKRGNPTAVKVNKTTVRLKAKKTFKLQASMKKKKSVKQYRKIRCESSKTSVAAVSSTGMIKAVGKGTCYVYAYAQNGLFKKVKIIV